MLFFILEPNVLVIRQILLCSCQCAKKLNKNTKLTEEEIETIQKRIRFFVFFTLGYLYPQATITLSCNCLDLSCILRYSLKGGDPAAPSDTATLLRLHPSHRSYLRRLLPLQVSSPTLGTPNSHGVTGGVYKTRERIHPDILIRDY